MLKTTAIAAGFIRIKYEETDYQDLDNKAVTDFVETAEAAGRLRLKGSRASKAVLQNFNLLRDGKPTNAAMLLFGKDPRRFFYNIRYIASIFMER